MRILKGTTSETVDTRTLNGRNYLVVPIVALVEGVRHSGSSEYPELVLAESFGRYPETWDGRPVVVDHPQSANGQFLSASDPEVLENFQLGYIMNSRVDDGKLLVEAWIDLDHVVNTDSEEIQSMWERLDAGETIEVSIGAIVYTNTDKEGEYQGKQYKGVWDIVIPDHLAILASETGACSIGDGCGTFRTQGAGTIKIELAQLQEARVYMSNKRKLNNGDQGSGLKPGAKKVRASVEDGGCQCTGECDGNCGSAPSLEPSSGSDGTTLVAEAEARRELTRHREFSARFCFSDGLYDTDIRSLLSVAIQEQNSDGWLISYNSQYVVYDAWVPGKGYKLFRDEYVSDDSNAVLLSGEPEEVTFRTEIVPLVKKKKKDGPEAPAKDEDEDEDEDEDGNDDEANAKDEKDKKMGKKGTSGDGDGDDVLEVTSSEELLARIGPDSELGKQLSSALALADKAKTAAVDKIMSAPGNKFTSEQLSGMEIDVLDNMSALLGTPSEDGQGDGANDDRTMNSGNDTGDTGNYGARPGGARAAAQSNMAPPAPNVFDIKKTA